MGVTRSHSTGLLTFVETETFTRLLRDVVSDDDYAEFQRELSQHPDQGTSSKDVAASGRCGWRRVAKGKAAARV
jgi:hypothetical protein